MAQYQSQPHSWHYSRIADYRACPHRDGLRRAGEKQIVTRAMQRGTEFHAAAARYCLACRDNGRAQWPELAEEIADGLPEDVAEVFVPFAEEMRVPVKADVLYIERSFTADLPNGVPFSGTLDMAFREGTRWTVVDWKTHAPGWMMDNTAPLQLRCYGWLLQAVHPEAADVRGMVGAMCPGGVWRSAGWALSDNDDPFGDVVEPFGATLARIVDGIASDMECRPCPGEACVGCSYGHVCEYHGPRAAELLAAGPEAWAAAVDFYGAAQDVLRRLIRAYVDDTGLPVRAAGGSYQYAPTNGGWEVTDYAAAVQLAREADDLFRTNRSKLPGVARVFKVDSDVISQAAPLLLSDARFAERAKAIFVQKAQGKPRFGLQRDAKGGDE